MVMTKRARQKKRRCTARHEVAKWMRSSCMAVVAPIVICEQLQLRRVAACQLLCMKLIG